MGQLGTSDSLTDYQCAGEHAGGPYTFDQNNLDWSGSVLLFSKSQLDQYNAAHPDQNVRVFVVEVKDNPRYPYKPNVPLTVAVNPRIEPLDPETAPINEGCLSVPDLRGEVDRRVRIRVTRLDRDGNEHTEERRGLTAGTFQHELDHLDGVLFLDRVRDPRTFTTWEQFDRHHRAAFIERAEALTARVGS